MGALWKELSKHYNAPGMILISRTRRVVIFIFPETSGGINRQLHLFTMNWEMGRGQKSIQLDVFLYSAFHDSHPKALYVQNNI